jgi:hypothetical protein
MTSDKIRKNYIWCQIPQCHHSCKTCTMHRYKLLTCNLFIFFKQRLFFFCQILIKIYLLPPLIIIIVCHKFQVVRYHSLVIDSESLPEVLIPIAWTSNRTLPFIGSEVLDKYNGHELQTDQSIFLDSFLPEAGNGSSSLVDYGQTRNAGVLMGVKHSTRPHYGVQVLSTKMICL